MGIGMLRRHHDVPPGQAKKNVEPPPATIPEEPVLPPVEFTGGAVALLEENEIALTAYDGPGTGANGKVTKADVEGWLTEE